MVLSDAKIHNAATDASKTLPGPEQVIYLSFFAGAEWAKQQVEPILDEYADKVDLQRKQIEALQAENNTLKSDVFGLVKELQGVIDLLKTL